MKKTFDQLTAPILALKPRGEIMLESVPAPQKLAPHALAMTADSRVVIPPAGLMERTLAAVNPLRRKRALVIFSFAVYF